MCENRWEMLKIRVRSLVSRKERFPSSLLLTVLCLTGLRSKLHEIMVRNRIVWFGCRELVSVAEDVPSNLQQSVFFLSIFSSDYWRLPDFYTNWCNYPSCFYIAVYSCFFFFLVLCPSFFIFFFLIPSIFLSFVWNNFSSMQTPTIWNLKGAYFPESLYRRENVKDLHIF